MAIVGTSAGGTGDITSVVDDAGNPWTQLHDTGFPGVQYTHLSAWVCPNALSVTSVTATSSGPRTWQMQVFEVSGVPHGSPVALTAVQTNAAGLTHSTPSITPAVAGCVVLGAVQTGGTGNTVALTGSVYTARTDPPAAVDGHLRSASRVADAAEAEQVTWSSTVAVQSASMIVALKPSAAYPEGLPPSVLLGLSALDAQILTALTVAATFVVDIPAEIRKSMIGMETRTFVIEPENRRTRVE